MSETISPKIYRKPIDNIPGVGPPKDHAKAVLNELGRSSFWTGRLVGQGRSSHPPTKMQLQIAVSPVPVRVFLMHHRVHFLLHLCTWSFECISLPPSVPKPGVFSMGSDMHRSNADAGVADAELEDGGGGLGRRAELVDLREKFLERTQPPVYLPYRSMTLLNFTGVGHAKTIKQKKQYTTYKEVRDQVLLFFFGLVGLHYACQTSLLMNCFYFMSYNKVSSWVWNFIYLDLATVTNFGLFII